MMNSISRLSLVMILALAAGHARAQWAPKEGPLMTRWAKDVSPENTHPEYPRPQMQREEWLNLNGLWDYAIVAKDAPRPERFEGKILVPFPVESALSGVMRKVGEDNRVWYRRELDLPGNWNGQRILLHFGAVDWESTVWVNGKKVGDHRGGYDPFSFDITDALTKEGKQEIIVSAWDPTTAGTQPIGKQHNRPHGIWYTPTTGIWQTVWLEPVPQSHIESFLITPDIDKGAVTITVSYRARPGRVRIKAVALEGDRAITEGQIDVARDDQSPTGAASLTLAIPQAKLWSPESPHLYDLKISLEAGGESDGISSYFAMRKTSLGKDEKGVTRFFLNNKPYFQLGLLDQGFWPDGLYTAPTDEALRYDIEMTLKLGFNMARKHVKVEPHRWYYWCDKLGLLVWQDMPSGDRHVRPGQGEITRTKESAENFERELRAMINSLRNHPSIILWVPFNEGWGQFDTVRITNWVKQHDPTRLVICASGWNDYPVGDAHDIHAYPGPAAPRPEENRAAVLGEFGGLGLPLEGHTWLDRGNWGYRTYTDKQSLMDAYEMLMFRLRPLIHNDGLSAAVYTQTTDVEIEVNGVMTYDRAVLKLDLERAKGAHARLALPPPEVITVIPASQAQPAQWRYTTEAPQEAWHLPDFDDSSWKTAPAGFGQEGTPGAVVRTEWNTPDIWLRRSFELKEVPENPHLLIHHDEDAEVYINGTLAARVTGYTTDYVIVPINAAGRSALRQGQNTFAVHCKQTGGGQYIDLGLVNLKEDPAK